MKHLARQLFLTSFIIVFTFSPLFPVFAQTTSSTPASDSEPILDASTSTPETSSSSPEHILSPEEISKEVASSSIATSTQEDEQIPEPVTNTKNILPPKLSEKKTFRYTELMRNAYTSKQEGNTDKKRLAASDITEFLQAEKEKLDTLGVSTEKQKKYLKRLHTQARSLDKTQSTLVEKVKDFFVDIFEPETAKESNEKEPVDEVQTPLSPPAFHFSDETISVSPLQNPVLHPTVGQKIQGELKNLLTIPPVNAMDDQFFPVLQDVQFSPDAPQNDSIKQLATYLNNNPVEILNYVKNTITFESYSGLKKGALGCLQQKICNDVDTSALTIALMRSAGIPAHYKKSLVIFSVNDLKSLLGVEDVKSVFASFALNKVPVFTVTVPIPAGSNLDQVDLSRETHLAVQWVVPEIFYDYDVERGSMENTDFFDTVTSTESLRAQLSTFPQRQWIPLDVIVRSYSRQKNPILSDRVNFNTQNFWNNYLTYQGTATPLEKFRSDIQGLAGAVATSSLSTHLPQERKFSTLPFSLPFLFASGEQNGNMINEEVFSTLPDAYKPQLRISLLTQNNQTILEKNFFTQEVDNREVNLGYEGFTDADKRVIEQYGGLHQTPAELIDLLPYFQTTNGKIYNDNRVAVNLGDTLVLRFEMFVNGQSIQRDEKFSLAGNSEGMYFVFSQIEEKPEYTTNQKILAGGNAALAWKYLHHIEQERKFLNSFYDFTSTLHFERAVVTENRVLTRVNNTPTTFDFKGLTIDAGAYLASDVSRRGAYTLHRTDVRSLFGLDASFYEGRLFEEVTGLEGISTVKGLQYASARPQNYSVLRLTSANEPTIDTLPFSANTKKNMHTAVRAGNTVITPNRVMQIGNWQGILYINFAPNGTGQYAIGEQTLQNGGWTINLMQSRLYQVTPQDIREGFLANFGNSHFYYEDGRNYDTVLCRITEDEFNLITRHANWRAEYGYPCFTENKAFGNTLHTYILSSNGTYFFSPGQYDYWISRDNAKAVLLTDKNGEPQERLMNVRLDGEFKFNPIAGTYSWFGHYDGPAEDWNMFSDCRNCITAYYQPTQNGVGRGRLVYGSILRKLSEPHYYSNQNILCSAQDLYCAKRNWILNIFGFPTSNKAPAARSIAETTGDYQVFVGGHIYRKDYWGNSKSFYVPNIILQKFNSDEFLVNGNRGTGGKFGFPISDPFYDRNTNELIQKFEWKMVASSNLNSRVVAYNNEERRLNNKEYSLKLFSKVQNGDLTDIEAMSLISDYIAYVTDNTQNFLTDLLILYTGSIKVRNYADIPAEFDSLVSTFIWSDTGFKFKYNDSHYCMEDTGTEGSPTERYMCISNQPLHAIAALAAGYDYGDFAHIGGRIHEWNINPLGHLGYNVEDVNLTNLMINKGADLKFSRIRKEEFGGWILTNLGNPNQLQDRISRIEMERVAHFRKPFRVFEYEQNGNISGRWSYSKNIERINCGVDLDTYYQDYDYFVFNGQNVGKARAVLDKANERIIFLSGQLLSQYSNVNSICRDFNGLSNNSAYRLHMRFNPDTSNFPYLTTELYLEKYEKPHFDS